ncbi:hypothetical protein Lal_00002483 [Lupinus albus]|nr:hypothetical protein Lal_00002483 [Lupinus albus]
MNVHANRRADPIHRQLLSHKAALQERKQARQNKARKLRRKSSCSNRAVKSEEIEDHSRILSDLCQHRTRSPLLKQNGGGAIVKPREAEAANRFYRVPQQQLSLVA